MPAGAMVATLLAAIVLSSAAFYYATNITTTMIAYAAIGVVALWLIWTRPEFGLLILMFLAASFIPPKAIDLRLPVGGLDLRDLTLLCLLGMAVLKGVKARKLAIPWWPIGGLLLAYFVVAIFSALYAVLYLDVDPTWTLSELRSVIYLSVFFVTAWLITKPKQFSIVLIGLFCLADLTAAIILVQQFLGRNSPLLSAMLGNGWYLRLVGDTGDTGSDFGTVRVVPPNIILMFMMMVVAFAILVYPRVSRWQRVFCLCQLTCLGLATLFTYTRAQWIATVIAIGLVTALLPLAEKTRLGRYLAGILLVAAVVFVMFGTVIEQATNSGNFINNVVARADSIFTPEQTLASSSLQWRIFENGEALKSIALHPVLGVGLGNAYREVTLLQYEDRRFYFRKTRFVHNSYLYIAVKMGVSGLGVFLLFCTGFLIRGWKAYRRMPEGQMKRITLALLASFVGLLVWSNTQMHFLSVESTAVVGLMVGLVGSLCFMTNTDTIRTQPAISTAKAQ